MILIWLAALVVLLDQLTKNIVVAMMAEGQSIPIIPNIFHLTYILNPGLPLECLLITELFLFV